MKLYVITCASGTEWLVRASSPDAARKAWPADADPIVRVDPLRGARAKAAYLRELGQADQDA